MRLKALAADVLVVTAAATLLPMSLATAHPTRPDPAPSRVTVFATGLNNPRGLEFGPDGKLYVAEAGWGGSLSTTPADCEQIIPPVGPNTGGFTSSISRIDKHGKRTVIADGLPSRQSSPQLGSDVMGVADVTFVGTRLYAIEAGAGCSHGLKGTDNEILRVRRDGSTTPVANLSEFQKANPVAQPEEDDFEPDGSWYDMVAVNGYLFAVEPNHGEIVRVSPRSGDIKRVVDVSASQGHIVPTVIAKQGRDFYFGNLGTFPVPASGGESAVYKLDRSGHVNKWADGFTTILGLVAGRDGEFYVLESMPVPGFPGPADEGAGRIVRVDRWGNKKVVATGFSFPTGMTMGPDGALYVSNNGIVPAPVAAGKDSKGAGLGQILRVSLGH